MDYELVQASLEAASFKKAVASDHALPGVPILKRKQKKDCPRVTRGQPHHRQNHLVQ